MRWPRRLQAALGHEWYVVEEGLNGRTATLSVGDTTWDEDWAGAPAKSALLPERFRAVAEEGGLELIDLGEVTRFSDVDGIHLDGALRRLL